MRIVAEDIRIVQLVSRMTGKVYSPPFTTVGIEKDGEIIGGVLFNCYEGEDIHVSIAGKGWTKGFLAEIGNYCFNQLGCYRITSVTEDPKVVRIGERLGGKIEGCLRGHFGEGRDGFIVGITRDEYRF